MANNDERIIFISLNNDDFGVYPGAHVTEAQAGWYADNPELGNIWKIAEPNSIQLKYQLDADEYIVTEEDTGTSPLGSYSSVINLSMDENSQVVYDDPSGFTEPSGQGPICFSFVGPGRNQEYLLTVRCPMHEMQEFEISYCSVEISYIPKQPETPEEPEEATNNTITINGVDYTINDRDGSNLAPVGETIDINNTTYTINDVNDYLTVEDIDNITEVSSSRLHEGTLVYNKKDGLLYVKNNENTWAKVSDLSKIDQDITSAQQDLASVQQNITSIQQSIANIESSVADLALDETTVLLKDDLYAYTNMWNASNTNRVLIANKGDSLKSVFNKIFGTQSDTQPSITTNCAIAKTQGTTSFGGGEVGTSVSATNATITFTVSNTATASYGYKTATGKTTGSQTIYYPIAKQSAGSDKTADIKITLPTGMTATSTMVTAGSYVAATNNILYVDLNSNKQCSLSISLVAGTVAETTQTRLGTITAECKLDSAKTADSDGTAITGFLTYLGNDATDTSKLTHSDLTVTTSAYNINNGAYYPYYGQSASTTAPTSGTKSTSALINGTGVTISMTKGNYLWIFSRSNLANVSIQVYSDIAKTWADFLDGTTAVGSITLTLANSTTATYYAYRTNAVSQGSDDVLIKLA